MDRAVGLLMIFEQGDQGPRGGHGGAVERVHKFGALLARCPTADAQSPGLVIRAVGSRGDFPPVPSVSSSGHPRFQVKFPVGWSTQIARAGVDDTIGDLKFLKQALFDFYDLVVERVGSLQRRCRESEHLDLGELVDAVDAAGGPAVSSGLGAETVGDSGATEREVVDFENLVFERTAECDISRRAIAEL